MVEEVATDEILGQDRLIRLIARIARIVRIVENENGKESGNGRSDILEGRVAVEAAVAEIVRGEEGVRGMIVMSSEHSLPFVMRVLVTHGLLNASEMGKATVEMKGGAEKHGTNWTGLDWVLGCSTALKRERDLQHRKGKAKGRWNDTTCSSFSSFSHCLYLSKVLSNILERFNRVLRIVSVFYENKSYHCSYVFDKSISSSSGPNILSIMSLPSSSVFPVSSFLVLQSFPLSFLIQKSIQLLRHVEHSARPSPASRTGGIFSIPLQCTRLAEVMPAFGDHRTLV